MSTTAIAHTSLILRIGFIYKDNVKWYNFEDSVDNEVIMNNLLNKMERKIGKYAIRNLSFYIIIMYAIGYVLDAMGSFVLNVPSGSVSLVYLGLNPYYILHGQVWRIISWILVPPMGSNIFLALIILYFYYQIGTVLERTWGTFRYNLYIISGFIFTVIGAFALYGILAYFNGGFAILPAKALDISLRICAGFNTSYINMSIFLAFAVMYPNMQVLLMFVIPVKMKWMAYFYAIITVYQLIVESLPVRVAIVMSLLNFIVFFLATRNYKSISPKEMYRKKAYRDATSSAGSQRQASSVITKHKCAICGRTEKDGDDLEFRFCSKCNGNYEYCNEHLFSHKHIM